jgi:hypothetical protein
VRTPLSVSVMVNSIGVGARVRGTYYVVRQEARKLERASVTAENLQGSHENYINFFQGSINNDPVTFN